MAVRSLAKLVISSEAQRSREISDRIGRRFLHSLRLGRNDDVRFRSPPESATPRSAGSRTGGTPMTKTVVGGRAYWIVDGNVFTTLNDALEYLRGK